MTKMTMETDRTIPTEARVCCPHQRTTMPPRSTRQVVRMRCSLRVLWISTLLLLLVDFAPRRCTTTFGVYAQEDAVREDFESPVDNEQDDNEQVEYDDDDDDDWQSEHQRLRDDVGVDFVQWHHEGSVDYFSLPHHEQAAQQAIRAMTGDMEKRLASLFEKTKTPECRATIAQHLSYFVSALGKEEALPFHETQFVNECPEPFYDWDHLPENMHVGMIQNRTYQPPHNETEYLDDPAELRLCYGILTHDDAPATERLIEALYEEGHVFVVHVDGKESSDETYRYLTDYASTRNHVHVLGPRQRVRVTWGGFSMVNATMQMLQYAFAINDTDREPLHFHKFVHVASTSYPLASNYEIRKRIADYPLDTNFVHVIFRPVRPGAHGWHYFVECDDRLHRIHRLQPLNNITSGMELYTSSQWFILSREFAEYIAINTPGSFSNLFLEYVEHVVVADETFFGTVLRHTPFCTKHHNRNFLHLQFDRWESDLPAELRDERKCMMKDPNHCGRSPTTMTVDYVDILELSDDLFARKFVGSIDNRVKDIVDVWRRKRQDDPTVGIPNKIVEFQSHGVLIVAKDTVHGADPLCLGIGQTGNAVRLVPCFFEDVLPTLAPDWAEGAVILEETLPHNRWQVGPCTTDGTVDRLPNALINVTRGEYSLTGPRCMLKMMDGIREGRCIDTDSHSSQPGGVVQVFPCVDRWYQFVSFGDGETAPLGSMFATIPSPIVKQIRNLGHEQFPYMCFGVYGRGDKDEEDWDPDENDSKKAAGAKKDGNSSSHLSEWADDHVVTTQCTNEGAIIEWLFVPFIVENVTQNETELLDGSDLIAEEQAEKDDALLVDKGASAISDGLNDEL